MSSCSYPSVLGELVSWCWVWRSNGTGSRLWLGLSPLPVTVAFSAFDLSAARLPCSMSTYYVYIPQNDREWEKNRRNCAIQNSGPQSQSTCKKMNSSKWRFIGISYWTYHHPGGDWNPGGYLFSFAGDFERSSSPGSESEVGNSFGIWVSEKTTAEKIRKSDWANKKRWRLNSCLNTRDLLVIYGHLALFFN